MIQFRTDMFVTDIHTHHLPDLPGSAVYCLPLGMSTLPPEHLCSVGIHPWNTVDSIGEMVEWVIEMARYDSVVAIGETGLDKLRGAPLPEQEKLFLQHVDISEEQGKPVIIHLVRCAEQLLQIRRRVSPRMPWAIHGFRGNAVYARELLDKGLFLSFGANFCPDAMLAAGLDRVLLETDESTDMDGITSAAASVFGITIDEMRLRAMSNAERFFRAPLMR